MMSMLFLFCKTMKCGYLLFFFQPLTIILKTGWRKPYGFSEKSVFSPAFSRDIDLLEGRSDKGKLKAGQFLNRSS